MTEDRVAVLGREYFEEVLKDQISEDAVAQIRSSRKDGYRVVLVSDGIAPVAEMLADHVKDIDFVLCNRLEFRAGVATGRVLPPVIGGSLTSRALMAFARNAGIDLGRSVAYVPGRMDLSLFSSVGRPMVAYPSFSLRRANRLSESGESAGAQFRA
jgi:phosphoserine phosphatase